jgi:hypothetical protein
MEEIWVDVVDFEDYEVSNTGKIRSKTRIIQDKNFSKSGKPFIRNRTFGGKELKAGPVGAYGHLSVAFYKNGRQQGSKLVHRVVAEAFLPNPTNLPIVDHIDGNASNNNVQNLRWSDYFQNNANTPYVRYLESILKKHKIAYYTQKEYYEQTS